MTYKKWVISLSRWYHPNIGDVLNDDLINLTKEEYEALMQEYKEGGKEFIVVDGSLTLQQQKTYPEPYLTQQNTNGSVLEELAKGDWKVIRELERLYLSGTDINVEREALRNSYVAQTAPNIFE
jgi:hypothetical protein